MSLSLRVPVFWDTLSSEVVFRESNAWTVIPVGGGSHASTHENGGADEINVDGLSGRLADPQNIRVRVDSDAGGGTTRPRLNLIAGTNITLTLLDDGVDDEIDVTIDASGGGGGGGSLTNGTTTIDFGVSGSFTATVDVTTPIAAGNLAWATLMYEASADHNEEEHALLARYVALTTYRSAVNTLTIVARSEIRLTGTLSVRWAWSA